MWSKNSMVVVVGVIAVFLFENINAARVVGTVLGMSCGFDDDCKPIMNAYCREDVCECRATFLPSKDNDKCLRPVKVSGDACEEDVQCALPGGASFCRDNECLLCGTGSYTGYSKCDDPNGCAFHEVNNRCWRNREVGQKCSSNEECWIYPGSQLTRTCHDVCVCAKNLLYSSVPTPGVDQCVPRNAGQSGSIVDNSSRIILATILTVTVTKSLF